MLREKTLVLRTGSETAMGNRDMGKGKDGRGKGGDGRGDRKPKDPFKFPESSRRGEVDNFAVYLNYIEEDGQFLWFSFRSANKEEGSKYNRKDGQVKGGAVLLWGEFKPYCDNIASKGECLTKGNFVSSGEEKSYYVTGSEKLNCKISSFGEVKMLGTCLGSFNKYVGLKLAQSYNLVLTYSPDSNPNEIIQKYIKEEKERKEGKQEKKYIPCNGNMCYKINDNIIKNIDERIICDFILAFTKFIEDEPASKLKFDWFYEKSLICPPDPEKCEPYIGNVKEIYKNSKLKYNEDKVPKTKEEVYANHLEKSFRKGKNCQVLSGANERYYEDDENLPSFKPIKSETLEGKTSFDYIPMSPKEFYQTGSKLEHTIAKEQQELARKLRK